MDKIRWGIIGPGNIAKQFARGLSALDDHVLQAVASRDAQRGRAFAEQFDAAGSYDSYDALIAADDIDAIYVATPHPFHRQQSIAALAAGKAVLCEKPMAVNAADVRAMIAASEEHGSFLMEAMWTRFLPAVQQAMRWLEEGAIGEPRMLQADFCFHGSTDPAGRLMNPDLAGGGLLDVGVYCVALAEQVFGGDVQDWRCIGHLGPTGVDEQTLISARWPQGQLAALRCAVQCATHHDAHIEGSAGRIVIPDFWHAKRVELHRSGKEAEIMELPFRASGYEYEAEEVGRCLRAGLRESPTMCQASSLRIAELLDDCRQQIGLRYPFE